MVQRVMAARSLSHAKGGTIMAGFAKTLPLFVIIFPGNYNLLWYFVQSDVYETWKYWEQ